MQHIALFVYIFNSIYLKSSMKSTVHVSTACEETRRVELVCVQVRLSSFTVFSWSY